MFATLGTHSVQMHPTGNESRPQTNTGLPSTGVHRGEQYDEQHEQSSQALTMVAIITKNRPSISKNEK
jgi:hypothetical protein